MTILRQDLRFEGLRFTVFFESPLLKESHKKETLNDDTVLGELKDCSVAMGRACMIGRTNVDTLQGALWSHM